MGVYVYWGVLVAISASLSFTSTMCVQGLDWWPHLTGRALNCSTVFATLMFLGQAPVLTTSLARSYLSNNHCKWFTSWCQSELLLGPINWRALSLVLTEFVSWSGEWRKGQKTLSDARSTFFCWPADQLESLTCTAVQILSITCGSWVTEADPWLLLAAALGIQDQPRAHRPTVWGPTQNCNLVKTCVCIYTYTYPYL